MSPRGQVVPGLVVTVWLACMAGAFWYFELGNQRSFESADTALFDASQRESTAEAWLHEHAKPAPDLTPSKATVVYVYRADCPCNRFTEPHLAKIVARYRSEGVRFVSASTALSVAAPAPVGPSGLRRIDSTVEAELPWVDATPAALVYNGDGKLIYYGPYSNTAECGSSGGLVERVLDRALRGESQSPQRFYGGGCFCSARRRI